MKKNITQSFTWRDITESKLFFPIVALSLILLFDFIFIPGFFNIENRDAGDRFRVAGNQGTGFFKHSLIRSDK